MGTRIRNLVLAALVAVVATAGTASVARSEPGTSILDVSSVLNWHGFLTKPLSPVGKLYLTDVAGLEASCSGTLVGRSVVLTAAHCVFANGEERGDPRAVGYMRSIEFVPGHVFGEDRKVAARPYGTWSFHSVRVHPRYITGDEAFDFALIELAPDASGRLAGDVVGAYRVLFGLDWRSSMRVRAVGYPAGGWFGSNPSATYGNGQYACDSSYGGYLVPLDGGRDPVIRCTMTGGSSGGPWLRRAKDGWDVVGLNSRGVGLEIQGDEVGQTMISPAFGRGFAAFYRSFARTLVYR
jgi:V8-like Glu-specific endopeptidase